MVVADTRAPEPLVARAEMRPPSPARRRNRHQALERRGNLAPRDPEVAVTPLSGDGEETGLSELLEVAARSRRHDLSFEGEFRRRQCASLHERCQHPGARGPTHERRDAGDVGIVVHTSILVAASSSA